MNTMTLSEMSAVSEELTAEQDKPIKHKLFREQFGIEPDEGLMGLNAEQTNDVFDLMVREA